LCADDGEDGEEEGDGHGDWQARRQREEHAVMDDTVCDQTQVVHCAEMPIISNDT